MCVMHVYSREWRNCLTIPKLDLRWIPQGRCITEEAKSVIFLILLNYEKTAPLA